MSTIGKQLLLLRESKGLSQNQLANISKVPQSAISEIESGKRKNPGIIYFQKLSIALGVTLLELTSADSPECLPETPKKRKNGACDFH
ncbi:helix-turn-helix domain-containing protein [Sporomusa sp. KB1]|uniref:helix-turn-helix domain-containing protein n=1 Tax=Sporomusa sp. KB1 TaxID=943346 RepID=UPI0011AABE85|nr:helix-turn-helix transcriptional regulator [Sporomusa sp. KB1]TWH45471.1 putative transcriptional regulators [Sporomusa sp. KB1]